MDTVPQGIPHVICYIDDILVTGSNDEEHLRNLTKVFECLRHHGFRLKQDICEFLKDSAEFIGHKINAEGLHAMPGKVEAIISASEPQELRSLLNYYGKFVPNLLIIVHPLNSLLQHAKKWKWSPACSYAFTEAKQVLSSASVLVQYDPTTSHTSCRHICLLNCSCDLTQTSRRHREPSLPTPSQQVNRIMHRLRRKRSPSSLELKNSINTFMARSFFSSLTTNQFWQFSGQRKAFHHWQLLDYSVRKFCSLHTNIKFSSNLQRHMPMQMVCHDYHCHTNQI